MGPKITPLDLDFVRSQFPNSCWEWIYFDNAGGSYVPNLVINRIVAYMRENQVQPGTNFPVAARAEARINEACACVAAMIGADVNEVAITPSTSYSAYVLAHALHHLWNEGDEIIVAIQNHEANSGPWRKLEKLGFKIIDWPVQKQTGSLELDTLDLLLNSRTRLVAFPHVSNILGEINDVKAISQKVHEFNALVCVDGVGFAPHRHMDVKAWDVDFYLYSFYKIFGPHIACLYGKKDLLLKLENQSHYFFETLDTVHKINPASPQHEMIAGLTGIADYFDALAKYHLPRPPDDLHARTSAVFDMIARHEETLASKFINFITSKPCIRLIGPTESDKSQRVSTFSFSHNILKSSALPPMTVKRGIGLSSGHFYAKRLIEAVGIADSDDGVIRVSMAHYTTKEEVDKLVSVLDQLF